MEGVGVGKMDGDVRGNGGDDEEDGGFGDGAVQNYLQVEEIFKHILIITRICQKNNKTHHRYSLYPPVLSSPTLVALT